MFISPKWLLILKRGLIRVFQVSETCRQPNPTRSVLLVHICRRPRLEQVKTTEQTKGYQEGYYRLFIPGIQPLKVQGLDVVGNWPSKDFLHWIILTKKITPKIIFRIVRSISFSMGKWWHIQIRTIQGASINQKATYKSRLVGCKESARKPELAGSEPCPLLGLQGETEGEGEVCGWGRRVIRSRVPWEEQWHSVRGCSQAAVTSKTGSQRNKCPSLTLLPTSHLLPSLPLAAPSRKPENKGSWACGPHRSYFQGRKQDGEGRGVDQKGQMKITHAKSNPTHDLTVKITNSKWYLVVWSSLESVLNTSSKFIWLEVEVVCFRKL